MSETSERSCPVCGCTYVLVRDGKGRLAWIPRTQLDLAQHLHRLEQILGIEGPLVEQKRPDAQRSEPSHAAKSSS